MRCRDRGFGRLRWRQRAEPTRSLGCVQAESERTTGRSEADVGALGGDRHRATTIDQQAELARQGVQPLVRRQRIVDRKRDGPDIERLGGIETGQRRHHDVAHRLGLGIGIEQAERRQFGPQLGQAILGQAAKLQVGATRQVDVAVAQALGEIGQYRGRLEAEGAAARAHAHDQAVAAWHRPDDAGAPALHVGHGVHRPASVIRRLSS